MTDTLSNWKKWCKPNNNIPRINEIEKTTMPSTTVAAAIKIELSPGIFIIKIFRSYIVTCAKMGSTPYVLLST